MNIFVLDLNLRTCAQYHNDRHVVKMITEYAQMLSTAVRYTGVDAGYKATHQNHPCNIWVRESLYNWNWLKSLAGELHEEWRYRYSHSAEKIHKAYQVILSLPEPVLPCIGITPFAQAMPDQYRNENPVDAYRAYYQGEKQHIANWKNRETPDWHVPI